MSEAPGEKDDGSIEAQLRERREEVAENEPGRTPGDDDSDS